MTNKLELKSCHKVIDTVSVADVDSIFYGKPIDPDFLTVVMKNGKMLYCDEVCPIDSLQEEPELSHSKVTKISDQEEPVSEDLEEAAEQYAKDYLFTAAPTRSLTDHFKAGANRQKQQATNNNIWHSIDENADGKRFVVLYDVEGGYMSPPSRCMLGFDSYFINAMNKRYGANYTMWAYKDDLVNLSNVERIEKDWKEEPVSEDLSEYINELSKQFPEVSFAKLSRIAVRVAKWMMKDAVEETVDIDSNGLACVNVNDDDIMIGDTVKVLIKKGGKQ